MNRNMMRQAQRLQAQLQKVQEELETLTVEGSSGGGVVKVTMTGKQTVEEVVIDPEAAEDLDPAPRPGGGGRQRRLRQDPGVGGPEDERGNRGHEHSRVGDLTAGNDRGASAINRAVVGQAGPGAKQAAGRGAEERATAGLSHYPVAQRGSVRPGRKR